MKTKIKTNSLCAVAVIFCSLFIFTGKLIAIEKTDILIYGREGCFNCKAMKRNLDAEKIPYTFYDVDIDDTKNSEMWKKVYTISKSGSVTFPVMDIGGKILICPGFEEVKKLLASAEEKQETDGSIKDDADKKQDTIVNPVEPDNTKYKNIQDIKTTSVIFLNRYYKKNVWDAQRLPATPSANKDWRLLGFKTPFDAKTRSSIDWGKNEDRYLAFDIEPDEKNNSASVTDDIFNSGKKFRIVLNLFENNGTKVKIISDWGKLCGFGSAGFMYIQQGFYGTMFTNAAYKQNNSLNYTPDLGVVSKLSEIAEYGYRVESSEK